MSDNGEFKKLVRLRAEATGEKYTEANRALINAARAAVLPMTGRLILPRVAARFADNPAKPDRVIVEISGFAVLDLDTDEAELTEYVAADEYGRDEMIMELTSERITDWLESGDLEIKHTVIHTDLDADNLARYYAGELGVTPDQYAWVSERLTDEELSEMDDDAIRRLIADEYTEYPVQGSN